MGALGADDMGENGGAAYLLDRAAETELFKLTASDGAQGDGFCSALDLDERYALVGAAGNNLGGYDEGAAHLYDANTGQEVHRLVSPDPQAAELLGTSVALGSAVAYAGAIFSNDGVVKAGAVHVFELQTGEELYRMASPMPQNSALFGRVAWSDGGLLRVDAGEEDPALERPDVRRHQRELVALQVGAALGANRGREPGRIGGRGAVARPQGARVVGAEEGGAGVGRRAVLAGPRRDGRQPDNSAQAVR